MMRIAIISDIHSNLGALRVVLQDMIDEGAEQVLCLGDIIGYFAHPPECLNMLLQFSLPVYFIQGNHERLLRDECLDEDDLSEMAFAGILYANRRLDDKQCGFLRGLPRARFFSDWGVAISHDTFTYPGNGKYVLYCGEADGEELCYMQLQALPEQFQVGFLGHIHIPYFYEKVPGKRRADYLEDICDKELPLLQGARYIINPGSVGQPRDHDNRASYGLLDLGEKSRTFRLRRLHYNLDASIQSIDRMELADKAIEKNLKQRLRYGW